MAGYSGALDRLTEAFGRLPGIGAKSAERLSHHILKSRPEEAIALAEAIREVKDRVRHCVICFNLTESQEPQCTICRDSKRDQSLVCVVEQPRDLMALERVGTFQAVYHALLGRLSPLQGMGPEQLIVEALYNRVASGNIREIIMATIRT